TCLPQLRSLLKPPPSHTVNLAVRCPYWQPARRSTTMNCCPPQISSRTLLPPKGRGGVLRRGLPAAKRAVSLGEVGVEGSCDMNCSRCRVDSLARFRGQLYELSAGGDKRCLSVRHAPSRRFGSIYQLAQWQSKISHRGRLFLLANLAQAIARHALRMAFLD